MSDTRGSEVIQYRVRGSRRGLDSWEGPWCTERPTHASLQGLRQRNDVVIVERRAVTYGPIEEVTDA